MSTAAPAAEPLAEADPARPAPPPRIATLDIVRGIAVMGILAMNIVAFAMPFQAYMNPTRLWRWRATPTSPPGCSASSSIDGKMRGLFSFLFGASTLLVIERAAGGRRVAGTGPLHARMIWLLVFGLIHFYFIWFGDILVALRDDRPDPVLFPQALGEGAGRSAASSSLRSRR